MPEPADLAVLHGRELPQKDQLCGAFWGALALAANGYPADQDGVALRAGTTLAEGDPSEWLPPGGEEAGGPGPGRGQGGGVLCVCESAAAGTLSRSLEGAGFEVRLWDNGSADPGGGG